MQSVIKNIAAQPRSGRVVLIVLAIVVAAAAGTLMYLLSNPQLPPGKKTAVAVPAKKTEAAPDTSATAAQPPLTPLEPLLVGWNKPAACLVFTGQFHGYLEPCGCSERQSGGFARRMDLLRQLREEKKWSVAGFDVGGLLKEDRLNRLQSQLKLEAMLTGLHQQGVKGVALGMEELKFTPDKLFEVYNFAQAAELDVPFLGANVTLMGTKELGIPIDYRIVDIDGVKVGVTAIYGETWREEIANIDAASLEVVPAGDVLPGVIAKLEAEKPALLVLLSHASLEESTELAQKFPQFQIVVSAGGPEDPRAEANYVDKTLVIPSSMKGKYANVVGYYPDDAAQPLKFERVELDKDRFQNHADMLALMAGYQEKLKENWSSLKTNTFPHASGATYVGVDNCKTCHTMAFSKWKDTKHAHAIESLSKGRKGQEAEWVDRQFDPECLACHVTGWNPQEAWGFDSGFVDMETTPHLAGNQCENCHGPGSTHAAAEAIFKKTSKETPELLTARKEVQLRRATAEKDVCSKCHDHDNSPHFVFDKYWEKVVHPGKY